jgi:hypothetical protein
MLTKVKSFNEKIHDNSFNLICVIKNEEKRINYFIRYYKKIGVNNFVFIENNSSDNTLKKLLNCKKVNMKIYTTKDSYATSEFGTNWISEILNQEFKNKWCLVVDIDELFMVDGDLAKLKSKMEIEDKNISVSYLVDFYPKKFTDYSENISFLEHSPYYDKINLKHEFIAIQDDNTVTIKGGMRNRVYENAVVSNESVCLTKKSFFKYDFYNTHYISAGLHWILPLDFDNWSDPQNRNKWNDVSYNTRFYDQMQMIGHFKFFQIDMKTYFENRVKMKQDWNGGNLDYGSEYKKYTNQNNELYDEELSKKYSSFRSLRKNTLDIVDNLILNKQNLTNKEFIIIITGQRHAGTFLCKKFNELNDQTISLFEAYNKECGYLYNNTNGSEYDNLLRKVNGTPWLRNKKTIVFKLLQDHYLDLETFLNLDLNIKIIFLKRDLKASYISYKKAVLTGNWKSHPSDKSGKRSKKRKCIPYNEYRKKINQWFDKTEKIVERYKVPFIHTTFKNVISKKDIISQLKPFTKL